MRTLTAATLQLSSIIVGNGYEPGSLDPPRLNRGRVLIAEDTINVRIVAPPGTGVQLGPVFAGLRNHFSAGTSLPGGIETIFGRWPDCKIRTRRPAARPQRWPDLVGWDQVSRIWNRIGPRLSPSFKLHAHRASRLQEGGTCNLGPDSPCKP